MQEDAPQHRPRRRGRGRYSILEAVCDRLDNSGVCDRIVDENCAHFASYEPGCEAQHVWYEIYEAYMVEADAFMTSVLEELGTTAEEVLEAAQRMRGRSERVQHMLDRLQTATDFEGFCGMMRERQNILTMLYGGAPPRPHVDARAMPEPVEISPVSSPYHE